jgi:hypothetical protein
MVKKKWSRPECIKVKLLAEEAQLIGCKLPGQGSTGFGGGQCGAIRSCKNVTS